MQNSATQKQNLVPFTQFATDLSAGNLPNYSWITPNLCNDAHDCPVSTADAWLQTNIDPLIKNSIFQKDGLLIITFDESGSDNAHGSGRVACVLISPASSKKGFQSTTLYQHPSVLRLTLEGLGVKNLPGAAASAPAMWEFFTFPPPQQRKRMFLRQEEMITAAHRNRSLPVETPVELWTFSRGAVSCGRSSFLLPSLASGGCFRALDGAQPFSHRRVPRDEAHTLTKPFAFPWRLAGVPISGVDGGAVTAQTHFSGRLRHVPPALRISRSSLFHLWLGLVHGLPPVTGFRRNPNL
ncbi:MAG TPA: alkaline phosphatase family protein [Candidatus Acidoferrum sp.]|nr:alkaline phosphatase family protein [Candidatus Acidoferrum sp.]